jgi:hypothetical protein
MVYFSRLDIADSAEFEEDWRLEWEESKVLALCTDWMCPVVEETVEIRGRS